MTQKVHGPQLLTGQALCEDLVSKATLPWWGVHWIKTLSLSHLTQVSWLAKVVLNESLSGDHEEHLCKFRLTSKRAYTSTRTVSSAESPK